MALAFPKRLSPIFSNASTGWIKPGRGIRAAQALAFRLLSRSATPIRARWKSKRAKLREAFFGCISRSRASKTNLNRFDRVKRYFARRCRPPRESFGNRAHGPFSLEASIGRHYPRRKRLFLLAETLARALAH